MTTNTVKTLYKNESSDEGETDEDEDIDIDRDDNGNYVVFRNVTKTE